MGKKIVNKEFFMKRISAILFVIFLLLGANSVFAGGGKEKAGKKAKTAPAPSVSVAPGTLTVTGLDAYNGNYIYAEGFLSDGNVKIVAAVDISGVMQMEFMKGGEIVNGSVALPVWRILGYDSEDEELVINKERYTGSDDIDFAITVWKESDSYSPNSMGSIYNRVADGALPVKFNNGIASGTLDLPEPSESYSVFEMN